MNKANTIAIVIIVLILIAGAIYYFLRPLTTVAPTVAKDQAVESVSTAVEKTNPFGTNVDPYSGYKNPFTK